MSQSASLSQNGFPPEGVIFPLRSVSLQVEAGDHPFVIAHADAIARNWEEEVEANPALYNGKIVLQHVVSVADGHLTGRAHLAPFSALLYWRRQGRQKGAHHLFALPVPVSSDGAVIAIRMAENTANPGQVYCAAGSLDANDIVDGRCDIFANMVREVAEETGLNLADAGESGPLCGLHLNNTVILFRTFVFGGKAEAMEKSIQQHVAAESEPEIDGPVIIRNAEPNHRLAFFMPAILNWHFGRQKDQP